MITTPVIKTKPLQRLKMSYEAYLEFASNAKIVDWVDGEGIIYMLPCHQS